MPNTNPKTPIRADNTQIKIPSSMKAVNVFIPKHYMTIC